MNIYKVHMLDIKMDEVFQVEIYASTSAEAHKLAEDNWPECKALYAKIIM